MMGSMNTSAASDFGAHKLHKRHGAAVEAMLKPKNHRKIRAYLVAHPT